ncbi:class I SAM-dependent methyltransferase [Dyella silvatica]|uniref:class I SAM-dependent methyltransferase n=1 Tax=Dyella silvatica TaxID=2992128 RepID=UPI00225315A7|nr:class I SAM-dependent methyltransferase [Dyella silvatica]
MTSFSLNSSAFIQPRNLPISAWTGHIPFAAWLIEALRPRVFVELGTHHGASYFAFCQALLENRVEAKSFAVDTWKGDVHSEEYGEEVYTTLSRYHDLHYSSFSSLMRTTFDDAVEYFADGSIDLLHIDGLHTYEAVRHDFETWLSKMSVRGIVLFHDTNVRERNFGVWEFWSEISKVYPSFEFVHSHGLGVLIVGKEAPESVQALAIDAENGRGALINSLFSTLGTGISYRADIEWWKKEVGKFGQRISELEQAVVEKDAALAESKAKINDLEASHLENKSGSGNESDEQL